MILKRIEKAARKRFWLNAILLFAGAFILIAFLYLMLTQSARSKQKINADAVLTEIDLALNQNESQIETLEKQYHEVNLSKLKSLRRMFRYGAYKDILKQSERDQEALLDNAWGAIGTALLMVVDDEGNIKIKSDMYRERLDGDLSSWNLISIGLLSKEGFDEIIENCTNEESLMVGYENGNFSYYCLPINVKGDETIDKLYLIACESADILDVELASIADIGSVLKDVTVGTSGFAFASDPSDGSFIYYNDGKNDLSGRKVTEAGLDENALIDGYEGTQRINGDKYYIVSRKCSYNYFGDNIVISTVEKESDVLEDRGKVLFFAVIAFLAVAIFIILYSFILQSDAAIRGKSQKLKKVFKYKGKDYYINTRLVKALLPVTLVGIILFFCVSMYSQSLLSLSRAINQSVTSHTEIEQKLLTNNEVRNVMTDYYQDQYLAKTKMAEHLLEETPSLAFSYDVDDVDVHPITTMQGDKKIEAKDEYGNTIYSCANSNKLQEICDDNNFTSMYVFDDMGRVRATSNSDWFFSLSMNPEDQSYAFWDVVEGKKYYYVQDVMQSDSGESMQFIGCAFDYYTAENYDGTTSYMPAYQYERQRKGEYDGPTIKCHRGMVQIGISAQTVTDILEVTSFKYVLSHMYVMDNGFIIALDNDENHTVLYSPSELMIGKTASEIDFAEGDFSDSYNGFKTINGQKCFVIVREAVDHYIATAIPTESLYKVRNSIALASLIAGLIVIIGILCMTIIMNEDEWDAYYKVVEDINSRVYVTKAEGRQNSDANIRHKTPEQKLGQLVKIYLYIFVIGVWAYTLIFGSNGRSSLMNYILQFNWNRVPNIISFTACGIVLLTAIAAADLVSKAVVSLSKSLGARASTISNLFMACVKFIVICFTIFVCLYMVGFDARSLLTGAGLLSVVVGFGAQHLIADILSGIFIVLEGSVRVGDFVTIGDFRGEVREIGLRTTKIESDDFNVKIFNNSSISEIINMTKENSFASIYIEIPYDADVEQVERIIRSDFPKLREKYDKIVADPIYRGVTNFDASGIEINIWVPCFEKDRPQMERNVRADLIQLFNEHNISVPFTHIVTMSYEKSDIKE